MYCRQTLQLWVLLIMSRIHSSFSMCPVGCTCHNDILEATCYKGGLEYLPIQLNPELCHMNLSANRITTVHFLNVYKKLEYLDLSQNRIRGIEPYTFEHQSNLIFLNISHNNISRLYKESFKGLHSVIELDLSYNNLEALETSVFRHFTSLQLFRSTNNQLVNLEEGLFALSKFLAELILDENQLLEIPGQAIQDALVLKVLSLKKNVIEFIKGVDIPLLPELRILILKFNLIRDIDEKAFSKISALEYLDISDNNLTYVPTTSLEKLQQLTKLNIGGSYIQSIPSIAFRGLFHLKRLRFDRSEFLSRIDPRAFVDNMNLEMVWMDNNIALETLPTRLFHGNPKLSQIFIRNNGLSNLEAVHFPLDQLRYLFIGGNPLDCNCSLLWLWRLEYEQVNKIAGNDTNQTELVLDIEHIKCGAPLHLQDKLLADVSEYQMGCFSRWSITIYSFFLVSLLLVTTVVIIYFRPTKFLKKSKEPAKEASVQSPITESFNFKRDNCSAESFIAQTNFIDKYKDVEHWDAFEKDNTLRSYRHVNRNIKQKPHIVYV